MTAHLNNYDLFDELTGEQLSAVTFVQDYLQLSFDGPGFNVLTPVTVIVESRRTRSWDDQFRNMLCGQIAKLVRAVTVHEGELLEIAFTDGSTIEISLSSKDYTGPEAVHFHGFQDDAWGVI